MKEGQPTAKPNKSGQFLREKREELGLTVSEAAKMIGISTRTLKHYERDGISGSVWFSRVARLSRAYGINIDQLRMIMMQKD